MSNNNGLSLANAIEAARHHQGPKVAAHPFNRSSDAPHPPK
jgi:hypothetical protein